MNRKKFTTNGPPCPRCEQPSTGFEHQQVTDEMLAKRYYYRRWYRCENPSCQTRQFYRNDDMVWNGDPVREHDISRIFAALELSGNAADQRKSVDHFLGCLPTITVLEAAEAASEKMPQNYSRFLYFCGICWRKIKAEHGVPA